MGKEFKGDTPTKRLARVEVYAAACLALRAAHRDPARGRYLALAGADAAEVGVLRHMVGASPGNVLFVDENKKGLDAAIRRWPGVQTFKGPLHEAPIPARLSFANLDWMDGRLNPSETLALARVRCALDGRGSVIAWSFSRTFDNTDKSNLSGDMLLAIDLDRSMGRDPGMRSAIPWWLQLEMSKPLDSPSPCSVRHGAGINWNSPWPMRATILVAAQSDRTSRRMQECLIAPAVARNMHAGLPVDVGLAISTLTLSGRRKWREAWAQVCALGKAAELSGRASADVAETFNLPPLEWIARKACHSRGAYRSAA